MKTWFWPKGKNCFYKGTMFRRENQSLVWARFARLNGYATFFACGKRMCYKNPATSLRFGGNLVAHPAPASRA